eukprot:1722808-Prymnesium_polylepis.1
MEVVYSSRNSNNVLSVTELQQILVIETRIRAWASSVGACDGVGPQCHCELLDSVMNYMFPRYHCRDSNCACGGAVGGAA